MRGIPTAVIISGAGRYADPWHDFSGTSAVLSEQLTARGFEAVVLQTGQAEPPAGDADLIVVNAGGGSTPTPEDDSEADQRARALRDWVLVAVGRGVRLLATHTGANAFYEDDRWAHALGGRWVPGTSWHPPRGPGTIDIVSGHPITSGLPAQMDIDDERYSDLEVAPESVVLVEHTHDGIRHSMSWAAEAVPGLRGRSVYDALGHDPQRARAPGREQILAAELAWLFA